MCIVKDHGLAIIVEADYSARSQPLFMSVLAIN